MRDYPRLYLSLYLMVQIPVGFVLQGIKEVDGQKISWNGGTGIIPEYRGKKLGLSLMKEAEKLIKAQNVSVATLEALSENKAAISLYEKCGYKVEDDLLFLSATEILDSKLPDLDDYEIIEYRLPNRLVQIYFQLLPLANGC